MTVKSDRYRGELFEKVLLSLCGKKDRDRILQAMVETACRDLGAEAGSVILASGGMKKGRFVAVVSRKAQALRKMSIDLHRGIVGWCVRNRRTVWVPDVSADPRYDPNIAEKIRFPTRNILCAPVKAGKQVVGAVELLNWKGKGPSSAQMDRFRGTVDAVGRVVGAAR